ncbi:hypothetical protein P280DRAFT_276236 [Massarina eburnea CBS 473.64]|uniref:Uncharacterized protein n=1 Tax=Massarina eburnea CBS 473.64 TaxID=1395130 RepID=A0A6A6S4J7_9PLEO|nr:hypothetical protein P280DRAFT_276236 [Massarina eburnea CBS 473.64]
MALLLPVLRLSFHTIFLAIVSLLTIMPATYATKNTSIPAFNLSSPAGTDIWRKPPAHNAFNAPTHPSHLPRYSIRSFQTARLTFALPPGNQLRQYDQAGLLLHLTKSGLDPIKEKWLKTGIEWYYGKPYVSTVGCDIWADWSIIPLDGYKSDEERPSVELEAKRESDQLGKSLWVYQIVRDAEGKEVERRPLREVAWFFADEEDWNIGIGGYVCRPTKVEENGTDTSTLEAEFSRGVHVELLDYTKKLSN